MAIAFDQIPSVTELNPPEQTTPTVAEELDKSKILLQQRQNKCKPIRPVYKATTIKKTPKPLKYSYKYFCYCPQYRPQYLCNHVGNVVLDRDVLTKEEHLCYLATPKPNYAAPRKQIRCFQKKIIVPSCTARIDWLARPHRNQVKSNLETFKGIFTPKQMEKLQNRLNPEAPITFTDITTALDFIEEERRLQRVARTMERRSCRRLRKTILKKQRKQIRKIVCVLFEEMKDFLLNDQFLIDESSTLCSVILDQIINFTEKEFYTTTNLRDYQHVLANNLTVWINKFISNLNIQIAPPGPTTERPPPECFLPVEDYIPAPEPIPNDECLSSDNDYYVDFNEEGRLSEQSERDEGEHTEDTIKNPNT